MITIAIVVGGGISGSVLARVLAEYGHKVFLYESSSHYGGLAYLGQYPFTMHEEKTRKFLSRRVSFYARSPGVFFPETSWHYFCETLLDHTNIQALHDAPLYHLPSLVAEQQIKITTACPDNFLQNFYGELAYVKGLPVRSPDQVEVFSQYQALLTKMGFLSLGMSALYRYLTIEEAILQAIEAATRIVYSPGNGHVRKGHPLLWGQYQIRGDTWCI